ncbi:hypothetical protein [Streptomyces synnematoformans]|uniref:Uncharacterized protein n=1 Tax=Streptomyces synnematoformans TaxID=415721 RepID=A0ABN2XFV6_9ACTN
MLPHDLWGADGSAIPRFPGDNGDWTEYDAFLDRLISDVRAAGINPEWDVWNEPDLSIFWNRSQEQYLRMWDFQVNEYAWPEQQNPATLLAVADGAASVTVPWTDHHDAYTVTLLPPEASSR